MRAKGTTRWTVRVKIRGRGSWRAVSRAVQKGGLQEARGQQPNGVNFRIR